MPNVHAYALAVDDLMLLTSWMKWDMGHVGTEQDQAKDFLGYEQTKKVEEYLTNRNENYWSSTENRALQPAKPGMSI